MTSFEIWVPGDRDLKRVKVTMDRKPVSSKDHLGRGDNTLVILAVAFAAAAAAAAVVPSIVSAIF